MEVLEKVGFLRKSDESFVEQGFAIKASSRAFSVLSDALYANKIRAIIRELSCNAIDAQVAAGKKDEKFDLQLPNTLNLTFRIRDYGTGISPENITSVYTTYFESTKTSSNDFIGALGLGSKTPFCYTDNFQVSSYYNGKKNSYAAFINDEGMPCVSLISVENTTEPNGLEVSFAVHQKDHYSFKVEAEYVLFWLDPKNHPNVLGVHLDTSKNQEFNSNVIFDGEFLLDQKSIKWKLIQNPYAISSSVVGPYIVMGGVSYKLDRSFFSDLDDTQKALLGLSIHIEVPIGAVEVQASRETLSLNKRTLSFLKKVISSIADDLKTKLQSQIDKCSDFWNACVYRCEKFSRLPLELLKVLGDKFSYKGQTLTTKLNNENEDATWKSFITFNKNSTKVNKNWISVLYPRIDLAFVVVPDGWSEAKVRDWCRRNDKGFNTVAVIDNEKIVKKYNIGQEFVFKYDNLPMPPRAKAVRAIGAGKKKNQVYLVERSSRDEFQKLVSVDFEKDNGFFIKSKNKKPYVGDTETTASIVVGLVENYNKFVPVDRHVNKVYALTETQIKHVEGNEKWVELSSILYDFVQECLADPLLMEYEKSAYFSDVSYNIYLSRINNPVFSELTNLLGNHPINNFLEEVKSISKGERKDLKDKYSPIRTFLKDYNLNRLVINVSGSVFTKLTNPASEKHSAEMKNLQLKEKELFDKYPVLNLFSDTVGTSRDTHKQIANILSKLF